MANTFGNISDDATLEATSGATRDEACVTYGHAGEVGTPCVDCGAIVRR